MAVDVLTLAQGVRGARLRGRGDRTVSGLTHDSRTVQAGDVFAVVSGHRHDGRGFVPQALERGAAALLCEPPAFAVDCPQILVPEVRIAMARAAALVFADPEVRHPQIGITGTNGKTSVAYLVDALLRAAGRRPLLVTSIETRFQNQGDEAQNTTPEAPDLQRRWAGARRQGADALVMEASSHGQLLRRTDHIDFDIGVFTNLSRDHLDYHPDLTSYRGAKTRLFGRLPARGWAVLGADDDAWPHFARATRARVLTYGTAASAGVRAQSIRVTAAGTEFVLTGRRREFAVTSPLIGRFNVANLLAAGAVGVALGLDDATIQNGLSSLAHIPGRAQRIDCGQPFTVLNDFAHTPDALVRILDAARELTAGRLHVVFGCGGDRDAGKRPAMGRAAAERADAVTVTSDNPRTEDPEAIIAEIVAPLQEAAHVRVQPDRTQAIRTALAQQKPGDLLVVTGKGHERYQIIGTTRHRFDDAEVLRRELGRLGYGHA